MNNTKRKFPFRLSMHLLTESLLPLFCTIFAFSAMFMLRDVIDDITDFNGSGIPFKELMQYFGAKLLLNLVNIIPISILLSTSFMVVMLGKNNELTAIRAAGLSLARCAMPIWISAFLFCCLVFAINEITAPLNHSIIQRIERVWLEHKNHQSSESFSVTYSNAIAGRDWYFAKFDSENNQYSGIKVSEYQEDEDGNKNRYRDIAAATGEFVDSNWVLHDVNVAEITYNANGSINIPRRTHHDQIVFSNIIETPERIKKHSQNISDMNIVNLLDAIANGGDISPKKIKEAKILFWYRLTYPLASLVGALFGFALSIAVGRSGVLKGFASSIGLLILFFLTGQALRVWGINGNLPAFIAGGASNLLFLFAGIMTLLHKR